MTEISELPCLVCRTRLEVRLAKGRKSGKVFLMVICPTDGRHFRSFVSGREYVQGVVEAAGVQAEVLSPITKGLGVG